MENNNWKNYFEIIQKKEFNASTTLIKAIDLFKKENIDFTIACDLGCGTGIDTIELLQNGWSVIAIDNQKKALDALRKALPEFAIASVFLVEGDFQNLNLPTVSLLNASFSLPFCSPEKFSLVWKKIVDAIVPNGRFAGHFFGVNDSWSSDITKTFHSKDEVMQLFVGFDIEYFQEIERIGKTIEGNEKKWHVFHVVSKKLI
jgi:SAM-dependent methyltransferase